MSTNTTNYNLVKPAMTDVPNISVFNPNWDTVDTQLKARDTSITTHTSNTSNPHSVTKAQVGLGNADNTSDANKPISTATQTALNGKQATVTGAATTITGNNLTASRALVSNSSGKVGVSAVTSTELGYLDGVTSSVQTQLNGKVSDTGDDLTGSLMFRNTDEFRAIGKDRVINGTTYYVNLGCGIISGEGANVLEVQQNSVVLARLEVSTRGVSFLNANNVRTFLHSSGLTAATVE